MRSQAQVTEAVDGNGAVITIFGAKGGVGCTTIATNLAGALQMAGSRVCIIDLDFHLGDVLSFMDVAGNYSITDTKSLLMACATGTLSVSATTSRVIFEDFW